MVTSYHSKAMTHTQTQGQETGSASVGPTADRLASLKFEVCDPIEDKSSGYILNAPGYGSIATMNGRAWYGDCPRANENKWLVAEIARRWNDFPAMLNLAEKWKDSQKQYPALVAALERFTSLCPSPEGLGGHAPIGAFSIAADYARKALSDARNLSAGMEGGSK